MVQALHSNSNGSLPIISEFVTAVHSMCTLWTLHNPLQAAPNLTAWN